MTTISFTLNPQTVCYSLPVIGAIIGAICCRKWIWKTRKAFGLAVLSLFFTIPAMLWWTAKPSVAPENLPGAWKSLYDEVSGLSTVEARLIAIERFCDQTATSQPPLPARGLDAFFGLVDQTWDWQTRQNRDFVRRVMTPYTTALRESR
jgi:hypothetical protein